MPVSAHVRWHFTGGLMQSRYRYKNLAILDVYYGNSRPCSYRMVSLTARWTLKPGKWLTDQSIIEELSHVTCLLDRPYCNKGCDVWTTFILDDTMRSKVTRWEWVKFETGELAVGVATCTSHLVTTNSKTRESQHEEKQTRWRSVCNAKFFPADFACRANACRLQTFTF